MPTICAHTAATHEVAKKNWICAAEKETNGYVLHKMGEETMQQNKGCRGTKGAPNPKN